MSEDFSPEILAKRKLLVPVLKNLRELKFNNVHLRQDKIYVDGVEWNESRWLHEIKEAEKKMVNKTLEKSSQEPNLSVATTIHGELSISNQNASKFETQPHQAPGCSKRSRDEAESPLRTDKKQKETPTKTTIIGINSKINVPTPKNPIQDALKRNLRNSNNK